MKRSALIVVGVSALATAEAVSGGVTPISRAALAGGASVETFEGVAGVALPLIPAGDDPDTPDPVDVWFPQSEIPPSYQFASGVTMNTPDAAQPIIFDFSQTDAADPNGYGFEWGWGLSEQGGTINGNTPLPSGEAFVAHNLPGDVVETIEFTFIEPVAQVGAFVECSWWEDIGIDGIVSLEAFNSAGASLGLTTVQTDGVGSYADDDQTNDGALDTWIGLQADDTTSISSVRFYANNLVIDDLSFSTNVPSPAGVALPALAALFTLRRQRSRCLPHSDRRHGAIHLRRHANEGQK